MSFKIALPTTDLTVLPTHEVYEINKAVSKSDAEFLLEDWESLCADSHNTYKVAQEEFMVEAFEIKLV
jgi:hypothetical protein